MHAGYGQSSLELCFIDSHHDLYVLSAFNRCYVNQIIQGVINLYFKDRLVLWYCRAFSLCSFLNLISVVSQKKVQIYLLFY